MDCSCMNLLVLLFVLPFTSKAQTLGYQNGLSKDSSVSAIYVLGDSVVDSGNNNYVLTYAKGNFPPYGQHFPGHMATGRFTNGKLITDFIGVDLNVCDTTASYIGVKELVPPYLNKSLSREDLISGVCFASGGSGYDPITPVVLSGVITMPLQINLLKEYKSKLETLLGKEMAENHIQKALFIVSAGSNDFAINYLSLPSIRRIYTVKQYEQFVLQKAEDFFENLWEIGARRIGVSGTLPIGCWPIIITVWKRSILHNGCVQTYSNVATAFNEKLRDQLEVLQKRYEELGGRIAYLDIYTTSLDLIYNPQKYGLFKPTSSQHDRGCCGTGLVETIFLCNPHSPVCNDVSKYVYWDSAHLTERAYYIVFKAIRESVDYLVAP